MGYNTRKISLSLSDLGVQLPGHHNASRTASHRSPPAAQTTTTSTAATTSSATNTSATSSGSNPPTKRVKRSHTVSSVSSTTTSPVSPKSRPRKSSAASDRRRHSGLAGQHTPPPSPGAHGAAKLDYEGIKDDVVVAVLQQLESTGNRPHLIKEFAAILTNSLSCVESSANPTAIITSRLTSYIKRPWSAIAPCPLAKEQVTTHPRRVYYFLSTQPRQPIPEYSETLVGGKRIISPSISSGPDEEEADGAQGIESRQLSPSPEVEFSTQDEDMSHEHAMSNLSFSAPEAADTTDNSHESYVQRSASPPLEHDEREFSQTASVLFQRKESEQAEAEQRQQEQQHASAATSAAATPGMDPDLDALAEAEEETEESAALRNSEAAAALFGHSCAHHHLLAAAADADADAHFGDSPTLHPQRDHPPLILPPAGLNLNLGLHLKRSSAAMEGLVGAGAGVLGASSGVSSAAGGSGVGSDDGYGGAWSELRSPEHVELAELDDLLGGY